MGKNVGWRYLIDQLDIDDETEGFVSENSDGSSCYYGDDGSWGTKNTDGSALFYGEDGSWGTKDIDGNITYYGNDGSWGCGNLNNGLDFFEGSDENVDQGFQKDSDEIANDSKKLDKTTLLGAGIFFVGLGLKAYEKRKEEEEEREKKEEKREKEIAREKERKKERKKEKRKQERQIKKKRIAAYLFHRKRIHLEYSISALVGESIETVLKILHESGFISFTLVPIKDIYIGSKRCAGEVSQITVDGESGTYADTEISYDANITISYHMKKELAYPYSPHQVVNMNYKKLMFELWGIGFTRINTKKIMDLKFGWLKKDGAVQQVIINDKKKYKRGSCFVYDDEILIEYHTFKEK